MLDSEVIRSFEDAAVARGLIIPRGGVIPDGKIHSCDVAAHGNHGKGDGRYLLYPDEPPAGGFQNWRDGLPWEKWSGNGRSRKPTADEMATWESRRREREEAELRDKERVARESAETWARAGQPAFNHPYLSKKRIRKFAKHLRVDDGKILVPLRDTDGKLWNLQRIGLDGTKRFPTAGRVKGLYFAIGPKLEPEGTVIIAEGMATAASAHIATGLSTAAAMFAGNLAPVGQGIREKHPKARIVFFADNDESETGMKAATDAARAVGGLVAMPPRTGEDANDLLVREGPEAVRQVFEAAIETAGSQVTPAVNQTMPETTAEKRDDSAPSDAESPEADEGKPVIYTDTGELNAITNTVWRAIEKANRVDPWLFRRGGPVRVAADDEGRVTLEDLTIDRARYEADRVATFRAHGKGKNRADVESKPPLDVVKDLLATPADKMPLPVLSRLTDVPTFANDGTLCDRPGFNPANRSYYSPARGLSIPEIYAAPDENAVRESRDLLMESLTDFPFKGDADLAHLLALGLLPFCRDMIDGPTPMHSITAPAPGTGKGKAAITALYAATGGNIGIISQTTEEEYRKRVTTELGRGRVAVILDNINRPLDSAVLSSVLTAPIWSDRRMAKHEDITIPNKAAWALTANNPVLSLEIARRCVRTQLDSNTEKPWERDGFLHPDLERWTAANRGRLVAANLTLIRAWIADGRPEWKGRPLGSFESWSRILGGILDRAGIGGFLSNLEELYEAVDLEGAIWRELAHAWWTQFQEKEVGVSDLFPIALKIESLDLGRGATERSQKTALGKKLAAMKDRVMGDYRILASRKSKRANIWRLVSTATGRVNKG